VARVSLLDEKTHPELSAITAKIRGARGGRLLNIYRMMLHSPEMARAWFELNQSVRSHTEIDGQSRELSILRVAGLNGVDYILRAHIPAYAPKEGITPSQLEDLTNWRESKAFSSPQRALLAYVDAMTLDIDVSDAVFAEIRNHYSERQTVELTILIGAYNMLSRVLKALKIDPETD
jgi:4-carboxymuconolactone decarboxylase